MTRFASPLARAALCASFLLALAACGGHGSSTPAAPVIQLGGSVAVGAPITNGKVRVLDANGTVVASDITVQDDGSYTIGALSGPAPYRIEACGYAGPNYQCIYSVAQGPGTANVTPLTSATVLLATNQAPGDLMSGSNTGLSTSAVNAAQDRLRTSLATVMAGNVPAGFDFVSGDLAGGSRTGYDRLLDSVGVNTGIDDKPFVQITPRLGSGNIYLDETTTAGSVTVAQGASDLSLTGVETLFRNMTAAVRDADACSNPTTGIATLMAAGARMSDDEGNPITGASAVGAGLCTMFASQDMFGATLLSPKLGRCDLGGDAVVCAVSFVLKRDDSVEPVGQGMGVTREAGVWKFLGDLSPVQIHASAKAQRDITYQDGVGTITYSRAIAFDIPALTGLQCARVTQRDAAQALVTIAYYKRYSTGTVRRLSLWQEDAMSNHRSVDPAVGALRSADDTWVALPDGAEGDAVVRNFFRGGRTVTVSLFNDSGCTTAFEVEGRSSFDVDVEGVPPVSTAMASLPWTELTPAARQALFDLTLAPHASASYAAAWTFPHGPMALNGATFCIDRALCGDGGAGRINQERRFAAGATSAEISLVNNNVAVEATSYKMLALYGRTGDGLDLQSNAVACPPNSGNQCH